MSVNEKRAELPGTNVVRIRDKMTIQLIIEFVIAIAVLIFVHEFGHFIVMKLLKIEVEEFGFGFPTSHVDTF